MLVAILKVKVHEFRANAEKIKDTVCKKSRRNKENITLVSSHAEYSGHVGGHLGKKAYENDLGTESILCAENCVKIRYGLGGEAGHRHTDARRVFPKEQRNCH